MPGFRPNQPLSHFHTIPSAILVVVTVLFVDESKDLKIAEAHWRLGLIGGELFAIALFYMGRLVNIATIRKGQCPNWYFDLHKKLRLPYSYLIFAGRVLGMSGMAAVCIFCLLVYLGGKRWSDAAALNFLECSVVLIVLMHVLYERSRLGLNAWETVD